MEAFPGADDAISVPSFTAYTEEYFTFLHKYGVHQRN